MNRTLRLYLALPAILAACHPAQSHDVSRVQPAGHEARVRDIFNRVLPSLKGDRLKVRVLEVTYEGGGFSLPHRHPCAVIGYVEGGALRTRVGETPETVLHAGETFYEAPNGTHRVSANASERDPVRFLAFFICDNDQPLSVPVPLGE